MTHPRPGCPVCRGPLLPATAETIARHDADCVIGEAELAVVTADRAALEQRENNAVITRPLAPCERAVLRAAGAGDVVVARATATTALRGTQVRRMFTAIDVDELPGITEHRAA